MEIIRLDDPAVVSTVPETWASRSIERLNACAIVCLVLGFVSWMVLVTISFESVTK